MRHGFLLENGTFTTIDHPLASDDTQAHDLNDQGQIVGFFERQRDVRAVTPFFPLK